MTVAKVDDNGPAHGGRANPFTILEELKAADLLSWKRRRMSPAASVRGQGVVANLGAKGRAIVATKCLLRIALGFRLLEPNSRLK